MTFAITVDTARWRANALRVRDEVRDVLAGAGDIVPVIKGRGYGLGDVALASESTLLGVDTVAVGTVAEAAAMLEAFGGDVVVLEPFEPRDTLALQRWQQIASSGHATRVIRTIASEEGWHAAADHAVASGTPVRVVVEGISSMQRFGLDGSDIARLLTDPRIGDAVSIEGLALHLPLVQPAAPKPPSGLSANSDTGLVERGSARAREAIAWALMWTSMLADRHGLDARAATLWVSHLDPAELTAVRAAMPELPVRARVGTRLWHGDRGSLQASGTVLAVHATDREAGYRQRRGAKGGTVVVVSGGTAHGVALTAPSSVTSLRARISTAGSGALESTGRARSPFTLRGESVWFLEPPHVSVSLLKLPRGVVAPRVGDELPCEVRYTITSADEVRWA